VRRRIVFEILRKELVETLRDRRTLLMMVALPVVIYPLLMIGFSKLQVSQQEATEERVSRIAVWGVESPGFRDAITKGGRVTVDGGVVPPDWRRAH
jgi:ABC-type Na+ efflux pump permease subunit